MGKILDIELSTGSIENYAIDDRTQKLFLGGRYLSTRILWDLLNPGTDPLSPENVLIVMTSPLTGTNAPSTSRYDISARSPLTGAIGHSNSGGNFGIFLKKAGYDGLIVRGRAPKPVYLEITDESVEIRDAGDLWGMNTQDVQAGMIKNLGKTGGTMAIGPAGEHLVKFASVVSQERSHGRTGMGAVMGSKNLKGMIARGSQKVEFHDRDKFRETTKKWVELLKAHPATGDQAPKLGTAGFLSVLSRNNALPTANFTRGTFERDHRISGERLARDFLIRNSGCMSCPIRCGRVVELDGKEIKGPEYEVLSLFGSNLLIDDMEAIIRWNYELDLLGMDTISCGTILGFSAELNKRGIWNNGIEFGKTEDISEILRRIAYREGIGDDLAEGVRFLSQKYGGKDFAPHSKGLELAGYEPRTSVGHGLGYATANRGACHLDGGYVVFFEVTGPLTLNPFHYRSKPAWVVLDQDLLSAISAGGNCLFTSWTFVPGFTYGLLKKPKLKGFITAVMTHIWPLISAIYRLPRWMLAFHLPVLPHTKAIFYATGMEMDLGRYLEIGTRGYTLERLFNLREGIGIDEDTLAKRFTEEPLLPDNKKSIVRLDKMLPKYYRLRGWNKQGIPTLRTIKKLSLDDLDLSFIVDQK